MAICCATHGPTFCQTACFKLLAMTRHDRSNMVLSVVRVLRVLTVKDLRGNRSCFAGEYVRTWGLRKATPWCTLWSIEVHWEVLKDAGIFGKSGCLQILKLIGSFKVDNIFLKSWKNVCLSNENSWYGVEELCHLDALVQYYVRSPLLITVAQCW